MAMYAMTMESSAAVLEGSIKATFATGKCTSRPGGWRRGCLSTISLTLIANK